jgi:DNA polymerase elongation subunit (family B)
MVTCDGGPKVVVARVEEALGRLHEYMKSCSLHRMTMALEEYYPKGIMLDKKRYCLLREDGSIKSTGISIARKDVSKVCQTAAKMTIDAMFKDTKQETVDAISSLVSSITCLGIAGQFKLKEVSRYVKKNERKGYEYPAATGRPKFVSEEEADMDSYVDCDVGRIMKNVASEIERFTVPCGIGRVHDIVRQSQHIM